MMTRSEFIQRRNKYDRLARGFREPTTGVGWLSFVLLVAFLFGGAALMNQFVRLTDWNLSEFHRTWALLILFVAILSIGHYIGSLDVSQRARQVGLKCDRCGVLLLGHLGDIAVASGRCGRCGGVVLAPDEPAPNGTPAK
jgi:hypothetical protein